MITKITRGTLHSERAFDEENSVAEANSMKTVTLSGDGEAKRNRRSRMGITLVRLSTDEFS
ncbi:hypothetical protein HMPREF9225_0113 [Peptoniphilus duerdenii ATCC BAA-1640]|uniref:Uncharacterized protein n=1 Tax=Peptoniphilus duerdenii ATCC BAA-1640 TaxID=862517 RepID=E0NIX4_9FIRM|nr:hypothetical protein HMPREF9225_0113 [Peptoniphilus duerdenii ATCC BAA-1640]